MNAHRMVYVIAEHHSPVKYGLAYGTLADHYGIREESFTSGFNPHDIHTYSSARMSYVLECIF